VSSTSLLRTDPVDSHRQSYPVRRYYDPQSGQFVSVDPLVDQTEAPYAYVNGNPVNGTDPLGLGFWSRVGHVGAALYESADAFVGYGAAVAISTVCIGGWVGAAGFAPIAGVAAVAATVPACAVGVGLPTYAAFLESEAAGEQWYAAIYGDSEGEGACDWNEP
jgi:RHS repeat-associated protein